MNFANQVAVALVLVFHSCFACLDLRFAIAPLAIDAISNPKAMSVKYW